MIALYAVGTALVIGIYITWLVGSLPSDGRYIGGNEE